MSRKRNRRNHQESEMVEENAIGNPPSKNDVKVEEPKPNVEPAYKPNEEKKQESKPHPVSSKAVTQAETTEKSSRLITIDNKLKQYVEVMDGSRKVENDEIGKAQYGFYQFLRSVLMNTNPSEFTKEWNYILNFSNKNKDKVFNLHTAFQGAAQWTGSGDDWVTYRKLMFLVIDTMSPADRRTQVNLKEVVSSNFRPTERNNLLNFYG